MKKIISLLGLGLMVWLGMPATVRAEGFRLRWVETDVTLDRDGKARIAYAIRWSADGGTLHGFYFEGFQETPIIDTQSAFAVDDQNRRYALSISPLSATKYDVVLADGQAFSQGEITYFFRYLADLQASGNLTQTRAKTGLLAVFNWAPVQWAENLDHETVTVHFPVVLAGETVDSTVLDRLKFMTEKYVNERYRIDYPTVHNGQGQPVFTVRFHRQELDSRYHFQIQAYLDAALFSLTSIAVSPLGDTEGFTRAPEPNFLNRYFPGGILGSLPLTASQAMVIALSGLGIFVLLPIYLMTRKQQSMLRAREGLSAVAWEGDEWVPPKIQLGTFRQKGKICRDLTPLEAGLLLEIPFSRLVGLMAQNLARQDLVTIVSTDPLRLQRREGSGASPDPYENLLLGAILPDGSLPAPGVRSVFTALAAGLEQKAWDCDLDATREHYRGQVEAPRATVDTSPVWLYYGGGYRNWNQAGFTDPNYATAAGVSRQVEQVTPELGQNFSGIKSSSVCYDGPFVQNVCHDACHSACHDACHSACHSACHGACHGACVSSGH